MQRGKTPIVVGGTGLYLRWFIHGKPNTPAATAASEAAAAARLDQARARGRRGRRPWTAARPLSCHAAAARGRPTQSCAARAARAWVATSMQGPSAAPAQAYAEAASAQGGGELSPEARWAAGVALVAALGDAASAERLRGEYNNQYRLLRVVDILLQSGGKPLAGGLLQGAAGRWQVGAPCRLVEAYARVEAHTQAPVTGRGRARGGRGGLWVSRSTQLACH